MDNKMDPEKVIRDTINTYGEDVLYECVKVLNENNIIFEDQFPFISYIYMKSRNFEALKEIFTRYGFTNSNELVTTTSMIGFEVKYCVFIFGDIFETLEDVEKAFNNYYK